MSEGEELNAKIWIEAGKRMQEWISVKDRLPEHIDHVLIYGKLYSYQDDNYMYTGCLNKANNINEWCIIGHVMHEVTHWMPLPKPPQQ